MPPKKNAGPPAEDQAAPASFEESLERLESIVEDLEAGSLTLENSIARYEEGVKLSKRLTHTLDEAEKRIERLLEGQDEGPTTEAFELDESAGESTATSGGETPTPSSPRPEATPARPAPRPATSRPTPPRPTNDELPF